MTSYVSFDGLFPLGATLFAPRKNRGPFCWVYLIGAFAVLAQPCGAVQHTMPRMQAAVCGRFSSG